MIKSKGFKIQSIAMSPHSDRLVRIKAENDSGQRLLLEVPLADYSKEVSRGNLVVYGNLNVAIGSEME